MSNLPSVTGVGAVVFYGNRVLLVKRAHPPCQHQWAIPGGKLVQGETLQQAAEREVKEETGITIQAKEAVFNFEHTEHDNANRAIRRYIVTDVLAEYVTGEIRAGSDASDARWFSKEDILTLDRLNTTTRSLLTRLGFL